MAGMLAGKVAVITGSTQGIGKAIAVTFAKEGASVIINGCLDISKCQAVALEIEAMGGKALAVKADVANKKEVDDLFSTAVKEFGKVDIHINNAGIVSTHPFLELSEEKWDKLMDVDLKGTYLCAQAAAREMVKKKYGRIINLSSVAGFIGFPGAAHYCAAKAGVSQFTKVLAIELAPVGINVNAIAPGLIETAMTRDIISNPDALKAMLQRIPLGRPGKPEEIANAALFLASPMADYVTGTTLFVDGGWTAG